MNTRKLLLVASLLLAAAGCNGGKGSVDDYQPLGPNDSSVDLSIVGAGTVSYNDPGLADCASDGTASPLTCTRVRFDGGAATLTATPATGWRFAGWSTKSENSENTIANPSQTSTTVVPGTVVSMVATFVPLVHPIQATFSPEIYSTTYQIDVDNPDLDIIKVEWSGPNCGSFDPKEGLDSQKVTSFQMTWAHPHGPQYPNSCDATTNHADVTITATVTIKDKTFTCTYQGAQTGTGPDCK